MRGMVYRAMVGVCLLLSGSIAVADFQQGLAAAQRGDLKAALEEWRPLAEQGDAKAQYNLGVMYDNGEGVYSVG